MGGSQKRILPFEKPSTWQCPTFKRQNLQRVFRIGPLFKNHESAKLLLHFSSIFATRRYFAGEERSLSGKTSLEELLLSLPHKSWNCCSWELFQIMDSCIGTRISSIPLSYLWSFFTFQKQILKTYPLSFSLSLRWWLVKYDWERKIKTWSHISGLSSASSRYRIIFQHLPRWDSTQFVNYGLWSPLPNSDSSCLKWSTVGEAKSFLDAGLETFQKHLLDYRREML